MSRVERWSRKTKVERYIVFPENRKGMARRRRESLLKRLYHIGNDRQVREEKAISHSFSEVPS